MTTAAAPPAKPRVLELRQLNIPPELCKIDAWVGWKYVLREGGWDKQPINLKTGASAKSDDPTTWASFKYALANYRRLGCDGIGLCRTEDLIFVDLDGVLDPAGNIREFPWAKPILKAVKGRAYIERSVSGTGIHAACRGTLPPGRRQFEEPGMDHTGFAFYDKARYFTFSGSVLPESGPISGLTTELAQIHASLFPRAARTGTSPKLVFSLSDSELLEKARNAKNGAAFARLFAGEWEGDYASQSEADMALCCHLAFWTGRDASRIDSLFRQSGLYREDKWGQRDDYRERTIQAAIAQTVDVYEPRRDRTNGVNRVNGVAPTGEEAPGEPPHASGTEAAAEKAGPGTLITRRASDIEAQPIKWLWPGRIARGKITILAGNPGLGKSQVTTSIGAVLTTGGRWPVDRAQCAPGNILFLTAEDDVADTLRPRLEAAGANLQRVHIVEGVIAGYAGDGTRHDRMFSLAADIQALGQRLGELGDVAAVVIDPITAYLGNIDSHKNADVRGILAPLSELASRHNVAIIGISHLTKATGPQALMRVNGSLAFVAAARAAYLVTPDQDDKARRLFLPMKNNLASDAAGLAFRIEVVTIPSGVGPVETTRVAWEFEPVTITADEAMATVEPPKEDSALDEATGWVHLALVDGPVPADRIFAMAKADGIAEKTVRRAAKVLNVRKEKSGMTGPWIWSLPTPKMAKSPEDGQDGQGKKVGHLQQSWPPSGATERGFTEEEI